MKTKLSFRDTLLYSLQYNQNEKIKIDIVNNFKTLMIIKKYQELLFIKKASKIPLSYYSFIVNFFIFIKINLLKLIKHLFYLLMVHIVLVILILKI